MDAAQIIADLAAPGRTLAFCDETDLTNAATEAMVANVHMRAALIMPSSKYAAMTATMSAMRKELGVSEFHGTEIVNPPKHSVWNGVSKAERIEALKLVCGMVVDCADALQYVHVSKQQYASFLAVVPAKSAPSDFKSGVKRVFLRSIAEGLAHSPSPVLIMDRDKPGAPTIGPVEPSYHLLGGGVVRADSSLVDGLQLVDAAAYAIRRYLWRKAKLAADNGDEFDQIILQTVASLGGRVVSMMK